MTVTTKNDDLRSAICAALQAGRDPAEIQATYHVSAWTVSKWRRELARRGQIPAPSVGSPPSPHRAAGYAALLAGEENQRQIAQRLGVSYATVKGWAKELRATRRLEAQNRGRPTQADDERLEVAWMSCVVCGTPFRYRYSGYLHAETLPRIERLCPTCFTGFCRRQRLAILPPDALRPKRDTRDEEEEETDAAVAH